MKKCTIFMFLLVLLISGGSVLAAPPAEYSEQLVQTGGRVILDCTIIRPWGSSSGPKKTKYPVIVWANGWDTNNNDTTAGYKPGLIEWALDGPYIVVAANSRSPKESDVLNCLGWIVAQNGEAGSKYNGVIDTSNIGLAGHSQGAGVMINASSVKSSYNIAGVLAMNPYAPNWREAEFQDGPVMVIGGTEDVITPLATYTYPAWEAIKLGDKGGLLAVLDGGDHNTDAWAPVGEDPTTTNFGKYQTISELWWQKTLRGSTNAGLHLKSILDNPPWKTEYIFTLDFELP